MFDKPESTTVSIGLTTKPYPSWRLPGWNRYSIGYFSNNGCTYFSSPFNGKSYGIPFNHGDIIGVGYRHRTGTIFFTRNGRRLEDAYTGLRWNLFPSIGANGPCQIHVNLGQSGFVFVEANVKKWALAPQQGTLAPPPMYGNHQDTILLASSSNSNHRQEGGEEGDSYSLHSQRRNQSLLINIDEYEEGAEIEEQNNGGGVSEPPPYSLEQQLADGSRGNLLD